MPVTNAEIRIYARAAEELINAAIAAQTCNPIRGNRADARQVQAMDAYYIARKDLYAAMDRKE